jgi:hypothetical protein
MKLRILILALLTALPAHAQLLQQVIANSGTTTVGGHTFSAPSQRAASTGGAAGTTKTVAFASNPTTGHLVAVMITLETGGGGGGITLSSVVDGASNSYTLTSAFIGTFGHCYGAYLLSAPANANKTLTATFSSSVPVNAVDLFAVDVAYTGAGNAVFDQFQGASPTGSAVTSPTLTSTVANEFLYSSIDASTSLSATSTPWTSGGANNANNNGDAYVNSSGGGNVAVNYTVTGTGTSDVIAIGFR